MQNFLNFVFFFKNVPGISLIMSDMGLENPLIACFFPFMVIVVNGRGFYLFPKFPWRNSLNLLEYGAEIIGIIVSDTESYFSNGLFRLEQKFFSFLNA